jgi:hypothetical protein
LWKKINILAVGNPLFIFIKKTMALLKEDGSLDIEWINKLPLEEWMDVIGDMSKEQFDEYNSKTPLNESNEPIRPIIVDYTMEEDGVDAEELLNNLKKRLERV